MNRPAALRRAPWQAPAQLQRRLPPPEHPWGRRLPPIWGRPLREGPHPLPPRGASKPRARPPPGSAFGFPPDPLGRCPPLRSAFWEARSSGARAGGLPPGVRRGQSVLTAAHQSLPLSTKQGAAVCSRELGERSWTAQPWQLPGLNCPLEWKAAWLGPCRPALCSGVDLLCDFWMSHWRLWASPSPSGELRIETGLPLLTVGKVKSARNPPRTRGRGGGGWGTRPQVQGVLPAVGTGAAQRKPGSRPPHPPAPKLSLLGLVREARAAGGWLTSPLGARSPLTGSPTRTPLTEVLVGVEGTWK